MEDKIFKSKIRRLKFKIVELKDKLFNTDYQAIKFAEGEMSATEFAPIREQRRAWRAEINSLEEELIRAKNQGE